MALTDKAFLILVLCYFKLLYAHGPEQVLQAEIIEHNIEKNPQKYFVFCGKDAMEVVLPSGSLSEVKVFGLSGMYTVLEAPNECGYHLFEQQKRNILQVRYSSCYVTLEEGGYTLRVLYRDTVGQMEVATVSCDTNSSAPRCSPSGHCSLRPVVFNNPPIQSPVAGGTDLVPTRILPPAFKPGGCSVPVRQRVPCAHPGVAGGLCWNRGCCVDPKTSSCYYPMDECSADGHFVFAVPANISSTPLNPESLTVDGKRSCKPIISNKNVAIFKFSVTKCGTRSYRIGETTVFLAEVHSAVRTYTTHYGVITRDHQVKIMVECRYSKPYSGPGKGWASTGFMVKSSSLPSLVRGQGLFGVQLRIAEDETFSSFLSVHHQPLRVLLGKPVYLEVRLISPKPEATLLVHYCVAYPRSAKSALVLLYEGCPNPLDSENVSVLYNASQPQNRHQRRFKVKAFQFMDLADNKYLNEEIYFMCSTEVCMSSETPCKTTCFDRKP